MTRRERLERKAEKRREWADGAEARSTERFSAARQAVAGIPPGQPILVGHHSEKRHRNALKRHDARMRRGFEESEKAENHRNKADGLDRQLRTSIYSDDDDAIERLADKITDLESQRDANKAINAAWRKAGKPKPVDTDGWARVAEVMGVKADDPQVKIARIGMANDFMDRAPFPPYVGQNLSGRIKQAKDRIEQIKRQQANSAAADEAGGVLVKRIAANGTEYAVVTFAEKPEYSVIRSLKDAGFHWGSGSWHGRAENLPGDLATA